MPLGPNPDIEFPTNEGEQEISGTSKQVQAYYELSRLTKAKMYNIYSSVCFETGEYFNDMSR